MSALRTTGPRLLLASIAYFALGRIGLEFASVPDSVSLIWAPSGLGLALLLLWGPWMLAAIVAAQLAISASMDASVAFTSAAIVAACAEPLVGVAILRRSGFESFRHAGDVARLVIAGAGAAAVAAAIGAGGVTLTSDTSWPIAAQVWWLGDFTGILVVAPFLLVFSRQEARGAIASGPRALEAGACLLVFACMSVLVFAQPLSAATPNFALAFLLLPPVGWAAYRFGILGAAFAHLLLAAVSIAGTLLHTGPFNLENINAALALSTSFTIVAVISGLQLAVAAEAQYMAEAELRENLTWLDLVQTNAQVATWSWDVETNQVRVSDALLRLIGLPESDRTRRGEVFLAMVHPDDKRAVAEAANHTHHSGEPTSVEFRVIDASGGVRWYGLKAVRTPLDPSRPGGPTRTVGINVDITDIRRMQEALRRSERLASLGTFTAGLAHEINNPIGGILLAAHAVRRQAEEGGATADALDDIIHDAERTGRIVKSVLQFSKMEKAGRVPHDLNACAREAARLTATAVEHRGVTIELELSDQPLISKCSATEIEQVLVNLIQNALGACSAGGRIRLESVHGGDVAWMSVVDDGVGMKESVRLRAFDPFYTTRTVQGGSGLGLSICHGIIESHGGQISISSQDGLGTKVEFSLPIDGETP